MRLVLPIGLSGGYRIYEIHGRATSYFQPECIHIHSRYGLAQVYGHDAKEFRMKVELSVVLG